MDPEILEVGVMIRWLPQVFSSLKKVEFQPSLPWELLCSDTEAFKAPLLEGPVAFLPFQKNLRARNAAQWASEWAISGTEQNLALSKATESSSGWGFFFLCTDCVFQIWNWLSSRPDLMTHSLTVRIKQQPCCDENQNHLRLGACRSQAVPQLSYRNLDFTKIRCWGLIQRGVHNIGRADNSNSPVTKEMVI